MFQFNRRQNTLQCIFLSLQPPYKANRASIIQKVCYSNKRGLTGLFYLFSGQLDFEFKVEIFEHFKYCQKRN